MAGHVINPSTKFEDPTAIRSWVMSSDISHRIPLTGEGRSLGGKISGEGVVPLPIYWYHSKGNWMRYNFAADSFYIMKLCSRLFVLYCWSRPKDDKSRHFHPHFEEVRGGVEPRWMARWKARAEFLLSVIDLLFLSLTVEALQGKMCQNSQTSGVGRSLGAKISGGRGHPALGIFFGFYKTRHILLSDSANCTVLRAVVLTIPACDGRTVRQTDGIAVASAALAMRTLRRAVIIKNVWSHYSV